MTEDEKKLLLNLLDKHELSLYITINLLALGSVTAARHVNTIGDEALECAMFDFEMDCMAFLMNNMEDNE